MTKLFNCRPYTTFSLCVGSLLAFAVQPGLGLADTVKTDEWQIEADKVLRFENPQSVIAEGNVVLTKIRILPAKSNVEKTEPSDWSILLEEEPGEAVEEVVTQEVVLDTTPRTKTEMTIKADWVAYDVGQNSIKAKGNVSVSNDTDQLVADEGVLDLNTETGTFKEATILRDAMDLHLEGETVEKTGVNTYHIENGWVITCKVPEENTPPWSFAASDTVVTQGEYAVMKHATFRIKDIPVLYTPWMMVPVGNKRKTGLLFPEISNSDRSGFGFNLPLFVNLSDSSDITLYPEYYANRGFMPGIEYRYILDDRQKGALMASYLDDKLSDPSETEYWEKTDYTHTNQDRYWVRGKLDHDFANDVVSRIDLDIVSDRDYLTEFNNGITGFEESDDRFSEVFGRGFQNKTSDIRENSLKVLKAWDGMALEGVFLGINDVREDPDPVIDPDTGLAVPGTTPESPLWKLPSLDFTGSKSIGDTSLTVDWDTDYVNYYRENGVGGHRVDIYPRLSAPIPLSPYLEARAEVGLRDTYYIIQTNGDAEWDKGTSQNRLLGDFNAEIGTTLLRDFNFGSGDSGLTHNFRPFVAYDYRSDPDQDDLPEFDGVDRKSAENAVSYGLDNFFNLFGSSADGKKTEKDYGYLKIQQSYDFQDEQSDTPFSDVNVKLRLNPMDKGWIIYKTDIDPYGDGFVSHTLEGSYQNSRGDYLNLDYRYGDEGSTEQFNIEARAQLFDTIFALYDLQHSISSDQIIEQNISLLYKPACWSLELKSKYTPGDHVISVLFNLANIGSPLGLRL